MTAGPVGVRRRRVERHGAAALRALSRRADAELRAGHPGIDGRPLALATPYLAGDPAELPIERSRGVVDSIGLLLRHSDLDLHRQLSPEPVVERVIFDILEQLRCESLLPDGFQGVQRNLDVAFDAWDSAARSDGMTEGRLGVLVYTIIHIIRGRLVRGLSDHAVEEAIEATWFDLAPQVGHATALLKPNRHDQRAYAEPACEVARIVAEIAGDDAAELTAGGAAGRYALLLPPTWGEDFEDPAAGDAAPSALAASDDADLLGLGDYRIFTTEYDRVVRGRDLYPEAVLAKARDELDRRVAAQAVSVPRLARRLALLFATPERRGWNHGEEDGTIDGRRLARLVTTPTDHRVFRNERHVPACPVAVTFLVDTSGSMKRQRYESVATLLDTFARALDLAGAECEVLGYTTGSWAGGRPLADWKHAGSPPDPGRLNEVDHIIYKSADDTWRSSRRSLASMMRTPHYREGLDGEAVAWAYGRLLQRDAERRILVLVSDGSPMDAASADANRDWYLDDHLAAVASRIEHSGRVELAGVGLGLDMGTYVSKSELLDLDGTITLSTYGFLERLFS